MRASRDDAVFPNIRKAFRGVREGSGRVGEAREAAEGSCDAREGSGRADDAREAPGRMGMTRIRTGMV